MADRGVLPLREAGIRAGTLPDQTPDDDQQLLPGRPGLLLLRRIGHRPKGSLYETCMDHWEGFGDDPEGSSDAAKYGKAELRLYRVKRGIQAILSHTQGRPEIRKRSRRPKPNQLTLF